MALMLDLEKNKGLQLDLNKESPGLKKVRMVLDWDEHPVYAGSLSEGFDLDLTVYALDNNGKITSLDQVCFFNNMSIYNDAVKLLKDNRNGAGTNDEELLIDLEKIPASISSLVMYIFVFEAEKRGQHFGMIANARAKLINDETGELIVQYNLTQQFNGQTAVYFGSLDKGVFTPDGTAGVSDANGVLKHYI